MGCKKFIIKKIENFFCTIVNGIPPTKQTPNKSTKPNQQPTNSQLQLPTSFATRRTWRLSLSPLLPARAVSLVVRVTLLRLKVR